MTELPTEAGDFDSGPFEPDNGWLASAPQDLQIAAMRRWFLERFENPANETPWDGEDKEYVFVWGGPYDPNDEIQDRFSGIVDFETMRELIEDLWDEVGDEWAPIDHEGVDYDEYLSHLIVIDRSDPRSFLEDRIAEIFSVLDAAVLDGAHRRLLHQMAHSSLISALEAYLADTVSYWVENDERALRRFVSTNKDFQARSLTVAELFERFEKLAGEVKIYLADFVWHRLDKVKPMLTSGLEIQVPEIGDLMKEIIVRHDIVHRAGRRADGSLVELATEDLSRVRDSIDQFSKSIEDELVRRFPVQTHPAISDLF
ncbi:MAG: hypothetical protein IPG66_09495 [Hydrogenophilales bacterium]|nr:hypothetical protein [Hydrogenophilales bacterium]